jgi:HK97 family phage portal protein
LRIVKSIANWISGGAGHQTAPLSIHEAKSYTLTDPAVLPIFGATPTISGRSISPEAAMRCAAVRAAAILISESVGATPFKVFERADDGKQPAPDHTAYLLVHDAPNDEQGAEEFRAQLVVDALLTDAGYAYVNRVEGRAVEMVRLDPTRVMVKQSTAGETFYEYHDRTAPRIFTRDEILRIRCPGGVSPIKHCREAIALALELEACAARVFSKGGRPSGVLEFPNTLGADAAQRMSTSWHDAHAGENTGRTAVLEEGGKFSPLTFNSVDAQFHQMRLYQVVEIARAFNVPPTMLMDLTNGTFANVEQLDLYFRTYSLRPWLVSWSRAYGRALLASEERARYFVEPVYDALAAADTASRSDAIAKQIASRVLTPNEARAMINLPAHPQGDDLINPYTTTGTAPAREAA